MNRQEQKRFEDLHARLLCNLALSPAQRSEYDSLVGRFPQLAREAELLEDLANMDARPSTSSRALAEAALAHFENDGDDSEVETDAATESSPAGAASAGLGAGRRGRGGRRERGERRGRGGRRGRGWWWWWTRRTPDADGSRTGKPRLTWRALSVAACAVVSVGTWWLVDTSDRSDVTTRAELVLVSGEVALEGFAQVKGKGDAYGRLLKTEEVVRVDEGHACFVVDPGISACLDRHSRLRIDQLHGSQRRFRLLSGQVALSLDHQPRGFDVTIEAAGVQSTAVGTSFLVRRAGERVETSVLEGTVKVQADAAGEHRVQAHQLLIIEGNSFESSTLTRTQEAPAWAVIDVRRLWREHAAATLHVGGGRKGAEVWLDGQFIGRTPLTTLVPSGRRLVVVRDEQQELLSRESNFHSGRRTSYLLDEAPAETPAPVRDPSAVSAALEASEAAAREPGRGPDASPAPEANSRPPSAPPSAELLLNQAQRLLRKRRFTEATERYKELRRLHPQSSEARTALVTLAQLQLEQAHDPKSALQLLQSYLAGGEGAVAQEARYLRIRALSALGHVQGELDAITDFLSRHPSSLHAATVRGRRAELNSKLPR